MRVGELLEEVLLALRCNGLILLVSNGILSKVAMAIELVVTYVLAQQVLPPLLTRLAFS
jgi:hypothetical protein